MKKDREEKVFKKIKDKMDIFEKLREVNSIKILGRYFALIILFVIILSILEIVYSREQRNGLDIGMKSFYKSY